MRINFICFKAIDGIITRFLRNEDEDKKLNYKNPSEKDYGEILAKKYYD